MTGDDRERRWSADAAPDGDSWVRALDDAFGNGPGPSPPADVSRLRHLRARRAASRRDDGGTADDASDTPVGNDPTDGGRPSVTSSDRTGLPRTAMQTSSPLVETIERTASVDDLTLVGRPGEHRYGRVVGARVAVAGSTYDLTLRLFRRPDENRSAFAQALATQLGRWADAADVDGVVPVPDAASQPRPWALAPAVGETLADRTARPMDDAVRTARSLAETVAALHDRGVVHAGIDPKNVVFAPDSQIPRLDNVGLLDVYRRYADPATALDPRYAPPEYFDDRYGVVDRATDVYGLGAVLFRLLTGRPPYDGSAADVRQGVLSESFPRPSSVAPDVPSVLDDVVERATAVDSFDRYETAAALHADLDALCIQLLD